MSGAPTSTHRAGAGPPLVCLHGFAETWRTWSRVLPALERRHDVLAPTFPGHAGGPPLDGGPTVDAFADAVERAMDAAGFELAHLAGVSLGGFVALQLAARGRARSVVALAPAGGWAEGDASWRELLRGQAEMAAASVAAGPHADAIAATPQGRRRVLGELVADPDAVPAAVAADVVRGAAGCWGAQALIDQALRDGWPPLHPERIACPVRIVWGTEDRLLPWPSAAARYREAWLPHADWVVLDGVGHAPQLEVPLETAQLVLGVTAP